jgi:hypothetical protein
MWSWSHIVQHRRTMRQYREAYVKKIDGKKVSKELQKTLTVSCHRFYSIWGGEGGVGLCLYPLYSVKRRILFDSVTVFLLFAFCRWRWLGKRIMINSGKSVLDTTLCDKFVSNLWQVGGFLRVLRFSPPIKQTATI